MTLPGPLFAQLWQRVAPHAGALIARPWAGRDAEEYDPLLALIEGADTADVPPEVDDYLLGKPVGFPASVEPLDERAFVVMCALDDAAIHVHPAFPRRLPRGGSPLGEMLNSMRAERTSSGTYGGIDNVGLVVPKGHLTPRRRPNDAEEASGADIAHQFEHLSFVSLPGAGRSVRIVAPPPHRFFIPSDRAERVGLAPIAEDHDDLTFNVSARGKRAFLDTAPGAVPLADRIETSVTALLDGGAGLVVLPELIAPTDAADRLSEVLGKRGSTATPALILAGSGRSAEVDPKAGRPYNEAVLMDAGGRVIARQRKLHQFNMGKDRMEGCSIAPMTGFAGKSHMEDVAVGKELVVCEFHGLGRVMTLICEDLEQPDPAGPLVQQLRPDWILNPVLDIAQHVGRWTHARANELARRSFSRVVISGSATLGVREAKKKTLAELGKEGLYAGLCVDGLAGRRFVQVSVRGPKSPATALVDWDPASWEEARTVAKAKS